MSALFAMCAPAAMADESAMPTTQAQAYNADWVPYLDPPEKPAAVCLVDSGVNITPDTPADSPTGPIVKRLALDGGSGEAASPTWEGLHGTRMAFVGAAPVNDWGAVGFWPGARIVSIRAMPTGSTDFPFDAYSRAVDQCNKQAVAHNVVAVNLSLGCDCQPNAEERARLSFEVARAHNNNQSVIAAAGNAMAAVGSPADQPGVVAVAAGDRTGMLCGFSNRGEGIDLIAPGCDVDLANTTTGELWSGYSSGTSGAAMSASVVLALLRSYRPDLNWQAAEEVLARSARMGPAGPTLDLEAGFRSIGLGSLVDAARARAPRTVAPSASSTEPKNEPVELPINADSDVPGHILPGSNGRPLRTPHLKRLIRREMRLIVSVNNRPVRAQMSVTVESRRNEFGYARVARVARTSSRIVLRLPRGWRGGRVTVQYRLGRAPNVTSTPVHREVTR
jgi:hypothetical protein